MEDFVSAPWLRRLIAAVVLAGLVVLGFRVLEPFVVPLVWACILAFVSWPAHARLLRLCRGRSTVASLLTTTAVSLAVIAPLAWLAVVLRIELIRAYHETQALLAGGLQLPPAVLKLPWLGEQLRDLTVRAAQDPHALGAELRKLTDHSFEEITHIVGEISRNVAKLLLIWGAIVVGWTDHIVRPFLISREAQIPFLVVMFGVLGGLAAFGLVGLFVGPVILAVLLAIWREWLLQSGQPAARG